jgi:hypothetical protein
MSEVSLYTRLEDIAEQEWNELLAHSADTTVFQQPAWLRAWWSSFHQPDWKLHLLCAHEGSRLVGLAPLYTRLGRFGGRELRLLGEGHSDYLLFPIRRGAEATAAQLLSAMAVVIDEGCNALLSDVLEGSVLHTALQQKIVVTGSAVGGTPAGSYAGSLGLTAVPEPGTLALFGFGLAAAGFAARRGRKASV